MPFDGPLTLTTLTERLVRLGINPIDTSVLDSHMKAQMARYPGNWAYHHRKELRNTLIVMVNMMVIGLFLSIITMLANGILAFFFEDAQYPYIAALFIPIPIFSVSILGIVIFGSNITLRKPAKWVILNYDLYRHSLDLPTPVQALLNRIIDADHDLARSLCLEYGELRRGIELLDPYIIVRYYDEECVLAIWDGDTILHIA